MENNNKPDNKGIKISDSVNFPSQLAPYSEKSSTDFGRQVGQSITSDWFYGNAGKCRFYTQKAEFQLRRLHAKAIQPMEKYYKSLGANGDKSFLNLPKKPVSIIPKLVDMICNGMANREYTIRATAIDEISQDNRASYRRNIENDRYAQPVLKKAMETFGVDVSNVPADSLPETDEEMELHMQIEYKPSIEISEELAIDVVFKENRYNDTTERMVKKDIAILGTGWAKHRFNPARGILLEYVDPENKVQSYTEDPFYKGTFYDGEVKQVLISDLLVEYPWLNEPENADIRAQLEYSYENWNTYHGFNQEGQLRGTTNVLYFTYATTRERPKKIKETGTKMKKVSDAAESFDEKAVGSLDFKRVSIPEEVEFEGVMVLGTDIVLQWKVAENMIRPKSNMQKLIRQYIGVAPNREKGYIDSLVARMIQIDDDIQIIRLKHAQLVQRMIPDGYAINIDAMEEIDLGNGTLKVQELVDMFMQTGSTVFRTINAEGNYAGAENKPITPNGTGGSSDKLNQLRLEMADKLNQLREVIGMNNVSDGSNPEKDSLVGAMKLAAFNSNVATRGVLFGGNDITLRLAEAVTYRIADLLKYSDLKEDFVRKIGAAGVADLEEVKNLHLSDFGIYLELELDDEDRMKLEADLSKEIDKGYIDTADKYKVLGVKNLKMAIQYLAILKKKRQKRDAELKEQEYKVQADQNIRAAAEAEKFKQQTAQIEAQVKMQVQELTNQGMVQKVMAEGEQQRQTEMVKGQFQLQAAGVTAGAQMQKQDNAEKAKDTRVAKQATYQSEMAVEKAKEQPQAIDFEAKEEEKQMFQP